MDVEGQCSMGMGTMVAFEHKRKLNEILGMLRDGETDRVGTAFVRKARAGASRITEIAKGHQLRCLRNGRLGSSLADPGPRGAEREDRREFRGAAQRLARAKIGASHLRGIVTRT